MLQRQMPADVLEYLMEKGVDPDIHNADGQPSKGDVGSGQRLRLKHVWWPFKKDGYRYSRYDFLKITTNICAILLGFVANNA